MKINEPILKQYNALNEIDSTHSTVNSDESQNKFSFLEASQLTDVTCFTLRVLGSKLGVIEDDLSPLVNDRSKPSENIND